MTNVYGNKVVHSIEEELPNTINQFRDIKIHVQDKNMCWNIWKNK